MLSIKKYSGLCVLGGEVAYIACLFYGSTFLAGEAYSLHAKLFELFLGFHWIDLQSVIIGGLWVALWSGIVGAYIAWMHNASIKS